ncbi:hypothetical protein M513_11990 [Trichuris suis]|uniref:Uncharacterized protein n=1 Tax=Trichuris suis TaxID=68888 RepID=A0A085LQ94_9BILA|nr:hypothetical protein M513_11990 [Trichuris suis]
MKQGGLELTKWASSFSTVNAAVQRSSCENSTKNVRHALGLLWDRANDTLVIKAPKINLQPQGTQRRVLKVIDSAFDPHGLAAPLIVTAKDEVTPGLASLNWTRWKSQSAMTAEISVERTLRIGLDDGREQLELHIFG